MWIISAEYQRNERPSHENGKNVTVQSIIVLEPQWFISLECYSLSDHLYSDTSS